jgi:hypothetical protein
LCRDEEFASRRTGSIGKAPHLSEDIALLETAKIVEVETHGKSGAVHRVPIWVVVIDAKVYVASVRGTKGRWWRELLATGEGALIVRDRRIPVRPHRLSSAATRQAVSEAYARKYRTSLASVQAMQRREALETTLRLELS